MRKVLFPVLLISSLFIGSTTSTATIADPWVSVLTYGAKGNGSTNDGTAIASAIAACPTGGTVYFPATTSYYKVTSAIEVNKSITIRGGQYAQIRQTTSNTELFQITASDVTITGLNLSGPQYTNQEFYERAISCEGPSGTSPISGIRIIDNKISSEGMYGIYMVYTNDFLITGNKITNIEYAGIAGMSVIRGQITDNNITNVTDSSNAYGITISHYQNPLATDPLSEYVVVKGNVIKDVPSWEGLDAHGGIGLSFIGNTIINTNNAICILDTNDGGSNYYPPLNIVVEGNVCDSTVTDGSRSFGIYFSGSTSTLLATGVIRGNTIQGHGTSNDSNSGGIRANFTKGLVISGNLIVQPALNGIVLYEYNDGCSILNNSIIDCWGTEADTYCICMSCSGNTGYNTAVVVGNVFTRLSKSAAYLANEGIWCYSGATGNGGKIGENYSTISPFTMVDDSGGMLQQTFSP